MNRYSLALFSLFLLVSVSFWAVYWPKTEFSIPMNDKGEKISFEDLTGPADSLKLKKSSLRLAESFLRSDDDDGFGLFALKSRLNRKNPDDFWICRFPILVISQLLSRFSFDQEAGFCCSCHLNNNQYVVLFALLTKHKFAPDETMGLSKKVRDRLNDMIMRGNSHGQFIKQFLKKLKIIDFTLTEEDASVPEVGMQFYAKEAEEMQGISDDESTEVRQVKPLPKVLAPEQPGFLRSMWLWLRGKKENE